MEIVKSNVYLGYTREVVIHRVMALRTLFLLRIPDASLWRPTTNPSRTRPVGPFVSAGLSKGQSFEFFC